MNHRSGEQHKPYQRGDHLRSLGYDEEYYESQDRDDYADFFQRGDSEDDAGELNYFEQGRDRYTRGDDRYSRNGDRFSRGDAVGGNRNMGQRGYDSAPNNQRGNSLRSQGRDARYDGNRRSYPEDGTAPNGSSQSLHEDLHASSQSKNQV